MKVILALFPIKFKIVQNRHSRKMLRCQTPDICKILQVQRKSQDFPLGKRLMGNRKKAGRMLMPVFFSTDIHEKRAVNNPSGGGGSYEMKCTI